MKIKTLLNKHLKLKIILKKIVGFDRLDTRVSYLENKIIYGYIKALDERLSNLENQKILLPSPDSQIPNLSAPFSQAATNAQFFESTYIDWCNRIKAERRFHRKQWEYIYILRCLEVAGQIAPGKKGVGFGVGYEPIVPYLASQKVHAVATDLDIESARKSGWVDTNQYTKKLEDLEVFGIASASDLKSYVKMMNVDMNHIPDELADGSYDFTWSACAFEHLGDIQKGLDFVVKSLECLKPGGVAVHTTEINISSIDETIETGPTVIFRRKDFEELEKRLKQEGHELKLIFNFGDSRLDDYYDLPPYSEFNHLKLKLENFITTSFGLFIKKKT